MMQKTTKKSDIIVHMEIVNEKYPSSDGKGNLTLGHESHLDIQEQNARPSPPRHPSDPSMAATTIIIHGKKIKSAKPKHKYTKTKNL
jgi:hypothetical protein